MGVIHVHTLYYWVCFLFCFCFLNYKDIANWIGINILMVIEIFILLTVCTEEWNINTRYDLYNRKLANLLETLTHLYMEHNKCPHRRCRSEWVQAIYTVLRFLLNKFLRRELMQIKLMPSTRFLKHNQSETQEWIHVL